VTVPAPAVLAMGPGLRPERLWIVIVPANLAGAIAVFLYFSYVDPLGGPIVAGAVNVALFAGVVTSLFVANAWITRRWLAPLAAWHDRLLAGAAPAAVPVAIRRDVLNAAMRMAVQSGVMWISAAVFYAALQRLEPEWAWLESLRVGFGIVVAGGLPAAAITFLVAEFQWRRRIPEFFPDGNLLRAGTLRLPIRLRLGATFFLTSIVPLVVLVTVTVGVGPRLLPAVSETAAGLWRRYAWAQVYVVLVTAAASTLMAMLAARFIVRPIEALGAAMAAVERGDLDARVPVRSRDELGQLGVHFNRMVDELREAGEARQLFGRYVSPEVARRALERGVELGGELVQATAMFADLRGFTARSHRLDPADVVTMLATYYEIVERVCHEEQGILTQFLGDGVVAVFGSPLLPVEDHARRAVLAARRILAELGARRGPDGAPLTAGVGICTGDMIAGNVGAGARLIYTIVGDAVNQAARLQVQTREVDASILVTESTRAALPPDEGGTLRFCGHMALRGIDSEVAVWAADAAPDVSSP
jgi:adenylate cyclase